MQKLLEPHFTWNFFGLSMMLLYAVYFLLKLVQKQLHYLPLIEQRRLQFSSFARKTLLLYELIVGVIGGSIFLLLNPIWHGILILFFVTVCFGLIRNYTIGKLFCFNDDFQPQKTIIVNNQKGIIRTISGLGLYIQLHEGIQYYNYSYLQEKGFSLVKEDAIDEYCFLNLATIDKQINKNWQQKLMQKLLSVPYLDSSYKPKIMEDVSDDTKMQIRVLLRCGSHQKELVDLMREWGYVCTLTF